MDAHRRREIAAKDGPRTWGRGRAVRLPDPELYASDAVIHLTLCAFDGRPFSDAAVAQAVCDSIERSAELLDFVLFVYCVMPDHAHILVSPGETETHVSKYLQKLKSYATGRYQQMRGRPCLWQPSANDRVKREYEELFTLVRYIADNPVRAGLTKRWEDWPYTKVLVELPAC